METEPLEMTCCACGAEVGSDSLDGLGLAFLAHVRAEHDLPFPDRAVRDYAEATQRLTGSAERLDDIGAVEVHPVDAGRVDDWLELFDHHGFVGKPEWAACYCLEPHVRTPAEVGEQSADVADWRDNRAAMVERLHSGRAFGYLAYVDGAPAGWVNASMRGDDALYRRGDGADPADRESWACRASSSLRRTASTAWRGGCSTAWWPTRGARCVVLAKLAELVGSLEPTGLASAEAAVLLDRLARIERLAATGVALVSTQVEATGMWRGTGARDALGYVVQRTGGSRARARDGLGVAQVLGSMPRLDRALRSGALTVPQAADIPTAVGAHPDREAELVAFAAHVSPRKLTAQCVEICAEGDGAEDQHRRARPRLDGRRPARRGRSGRQGRRHAGS